jgi:hypothetical protein
MPGLIEQIDALEPGILRVFRDSDADIGFREALMFLDDELIGRVDYKQIFEVSIHPGSHTLHAFNRVLKTEKITFDLKPGDRINFLVVNTGGPLFALGMMLGMGIPRIRLQLEVADPLEGTHRKARKGQVR